MSLNKKIKSFVTVASSVAVMAGIGVALSAGAARADWRDHHDRHRHGDWHGGYYAAPPVVYGGPVYAPPPVVYGPSVGIALPGVSIGIR